MTETAYIRYARTIERHAVRLHEPELDALREAANAVYFDEDHREQAVAAAHGLLAGPLSQDERLGPEASARLAGMLAAIEPALALR